jgi:hypothetical protein
MYFLYIYIPQGGWCGRQGICMIHIVEEIKLLLLLGNRLKHIRGNVRYLGDVECKAVYCWVLH